MKPESPIQSNEGLHQVLQAWKVRAQLPPRFQQSVWRQIERDQAQAGVSAWVLLWQRLGAALGRPSLATGYVSVLVFAGMLAGYWQVHVTRAQTEESLSTRYVQSVDPFLNPHF